MVPRFFRSSVLVSVILLQLALSVGCNSYSRGHPVSATTAIDTCIDRDQYLAQRKQMEKNKKYKWGFWLLLSAAIIPLEVLASSVLIVKIYRRVKQRKKRNNKL